MFKGDASNSEGLELTTFYRIGQGFHYLNLRVFCSAKTVIIPFNKD